MIYVPTTCDGVFIVSSIPCCPSYALCHAPPTSLPVNRNTVIVCCQFHLAYASCLPACSCSCSCLSVDSIALNCKSALRIVIRPVLHFHFSPPLQTQNRTLFLRAPSGPVFSSPSCTSTHVRLHSLRSWLDLFVLFRLFSFFPLACLN